MSFDAADADLDDVARRARVSDAIRARRRRTATTERRREDTTLAAALVGAFDREVVLHTSTGGDPFTGTVLAVGDDVVEVECSTRTWWLRLGEITALESAGPEPGDLTERATTSLTDLLTDLIDTDLTVEVLVRGGTRLHGSVTSVGAALWLRQPERDRAVLVDPDQIVGVGRRRRATRG